MTPDTPKPLPVWLLLLAVLALAANLRAPLVAYGPVVGFIQQDLGASGSFMGLVGALPLLAFALCSPLAARLARRFGIEDVLIGATVLMMAGIALRSAIPATLPLVLGTILLAAAIALGNVLLPAMAKRSLPTRIGAVVGAISAIMSLFSTLAAGIAVPLAQWQGWRWSLGIWLLTAALALAAWLLVRLRHPPEPAATGAQPHLDVWRMPAAWAISLCMGVQSVVFYGTVSFLPSVLAEKGLSASAAGAHASLFQGISLVGVLAISALFGRHRHRLQPIGLLLALLMLAGVTGLWLDPAPDRMGWWTSLLGIGTAGLFSLSLMLFAARTDNAADAAALSGMAQSVGYGIAILGPQGMGLLHDWLGSWVATMPLLVLMSALECVIVWFAASPASLSRPAAATVSQG